MKSFRNKGVALAAAGLFTGFSLTAVQGCDNAAENLCGPCGTIATGQLSISGDAQLDGFFSAVADLQSASATIRGNFEGELRALGQIYGMADGEVNAQFVADLIAEIRADINANVQGSLTLNYVPPRCSANVNVAVEAQASCEANAECEVMADPGSVEVSCEGQCQGSCSGGCSGEISCSPPSGSVGCDVGCEGTCELSAAASCEGTCNGTCMGTCSVENADGECRGQCDGMCQGTCELSGMAQCEGTCHGTCHASVTPPECEGLDIQCNAQCMGMCSGGCAGDFTPPSASADCEASAECNAQASAQAEANVECTPPSLEFGFELQAGVSADVQAAFLGRLGLLRVRLAAALQAAAQARALFTGEIDGEVVFQPSPVARIRASLEGFASADAIANFDIPAGRLPCVVPAFEESINAMVDVGADLQFTAEASADLVGFVQNPMG
jgi:hypothetical protein